MIRFVIGLPGAGKTMFCVSKIIEELGYTERHVVTNMQELKLPELHLYLQKRFPDRAIDLDDRLTIIPKQATFQFYRYRSGRLVLPEPPPGKISLEEFYARMESYFLPIAERPEWGRPVSYFLSEAHEFFPAKDWQEIGRPVKFYASKHRHLHDEVIVETQFPEQVEPNFRRLAQEFHQLRNHYTMSFGPFKNRGHFERRCYMHIPTPSSVPVEKSEYKLDVKGVANCYHTTGALGIMNRGAEPSGFGRKFKLPWWVLWVGAGLLCVVVCVAFFMLPKVIGAGLGKIVKGTTEGMGGALSPAPSSKRGKSIAAAREEPLPVEPESVVYVAGYALGVGGHPFVWLTNGERLDASRIREIRTDSVLLTDGAVYRFRPAGRRASETTGGVLAGSIGG